LHPRKQPVDSEWLSTLTDNYLENRKANANEQILYDGAALIGMCGYHSIHPRNPVEAAIDAK
jgi:hypothetical protein